MSAPHRRRAPAPKPAASAAAPTVETSNEVPNEGPNEPEPETAAAQQAQQAAGPAPLIEAEPYERDRLAQAADRQALVRDLMEIGATDDILYKDLLLALHKAGWFVRLQQINAVPHHEGHTLVTFAVVIGRTPATTQVIDQISLSVPPLVDPSTVARANALPSLVFLLFGRFPPAPTAARAAAQPTADPTPEPDPTPQPEPAPGFGDDWEPLDLVEQRTPDGLPIFYDPFGLGDPADEIVESVLRQLENEVPEAPSLEALAALYSQNQVVFEFIKETMPARLEEAHAILNKRRDELTDLEAPAPRRPRVGRTPDRHAN